MKWSHVRVALHVLVFALVALAAPACKGTHSIDVQRDDFENGTAKHPKILDDKYADLRDCLNDTFGPAHVSTAPLDSVVAQWQIVDRADDLPKYCGTREGSNAATISGCWTRELKRITLARPAIASTSMPVHETGHAWQEAAQLGNADPGGRDPSHGPKWNACVSDNGGAI